MNVVRCSNGHFFDGATYSLCPLCGASVPVVATLNQNVQKEKKESLIRRIIGKSKSRSDEHVTFSPQNMSVPDMAGVVDVQERTAGGEILNYGVPYQDNNSVASAGEPSVSGGTGWNERSGNPDNSPQDRDTVGLFSENGLNRMIEADSGTSNRIVSSSVHYETEPDRETTLAKEIRQASGNKAEATIGYFNQIAAEKGVGENGGAGAKRIVDPVTGWIVCTKGAHLGESFVICAGMNSIGREEGNRIVIPLDFKVSREKHAFITYEPKQRNFYIKPGESSGLTYVNGEYIMETKRLEPKDIIEIGDSCFCFIPLCDDSFSWEEIIKESDGE